MKSHRICLHGTLVTHGGIGGLITGKSGIGKSYLANELVKLGFQLVADDLVIIYKHQQELRGFGPRHFRGLMLIDKLIDVRQDLGHQSVCSACPLSFIYHLVEPNLGLHSESQTPTIVYQQVLGLSLPEVITPITPGNISSKDISICMMIFEQVSSRISNKSTNQPPNFIEEPSCTY